MIGSGILVILCLLAAAGLAGVLYCCVKVGHHADQKMRNYWERQKNR